MEQVALTELALAGGAFLALTVLHEYVKYCEDTEEDEKFDEHDIYDDIQ